MQTKVCTRCHIEKGYDCFSKSSNNKGGVYSICKECVNDKHLSDKTRKFRKEKDKLAKEGKKKCPKCGLILKTDAFRKSKRWKDGFRAYCRDCENAMSREHDRRPDIKEKRHNRDKTEKSKEQRKEYRKNSDKFKKTQEKYEKSEKRRLGNIEYGKRIQVRVGRRLRSRIFEALTLGKAKRKEQFWDLVGCSVEEFMVYIESLWTEGMSWDNYTHKGWHLDHIRPCASFDLTDPEQQKQCFHYTNYQPLWQHDNFSKGSFYNGVKCYRKNLP